MPTQAGRSINNNIDFAVPTLNPTTGICVCVCEPSRLKVIFQYSGTFE